MSSDLRISTAIELRSLEHGRNSPRRIEHTADASFGQLESAVELPTVSRKRALFTIVQLCFVNLLSAFSTGLLTIALPEIAASLSLPDNLLLWPSSVWALTSGSTLLLCGSLASIFGSKPVNLLGCACLGATILGCAFVRTGADLIAARALQGISSAMVLPSGLAIVSERIKKGKIRNMGFACIGFANMVGFSMGLVLGGVMLGGVGWRAGYLIGGTSGFVLAMSGAWTLPATTEGAEESGRWTRLRKEVDWVGTGLISGSLSTFSYVLAMVSSSADKIQHATTISLLCCSVGMVASFGLWTHRQEKKHRPALIPNSLWKNTTFTSIALIVMLTTATINCMELTCSLVFQKVQHHTALRASLYILPSLVVGCLLNLITGLFIHRVSVLWVGTTSTLLTAIAPLLMAVIRPSWSYWEGAFFAQLLQPLSRGVVFTVGILVISDIFPPRMQALAGAVFNTVSQLGTSIGLTITSVVSSAASQGITGPHKDAAEQLMGGYRASFWMMFAWMLIACAIGGAGLRKVGKVGRSA